VERIRGGGGEAIAVRTDVSDVDSMRDLVDRAVAAYGRLDAAFNNATDGPPPAPPVGQWAFDGHHNVVVTFTAFEVGPNGPLGTVTVHIKARVRGDAMTGTYTATGVAPNGGALFPPDNGSFSGTRVTAEG
jgi:NAD(P)-dependent dehydrogenase (short-subunit alcohol dehydrogenase family)